MTRPHPRSHATSGSDGKSIAATSRTSRKYLYDMQQACVEIRAFCSDVSVEAFRENRLLQAAVQRKLQVLGESIFQMSRFWADEVEALPGSRDLINLRHVLVHGYDEIEQDVVWGIVIGYLPPLEAALESALLAAENDA